MDWFVKLDVYIQFTFIVGIVSLLVFVVHAVSKQDY